jgi:beta-glucosidase
VPIYTFPPGFLWGAATAAYQIEGAHDQDGRGESIWDRFSHTPGRTYLGHTGDVACDHYHRMESDVALMSELGLQSYRFSVSWPRVLPTGRGAVNPHGLGFYDRLVDRLLAAGIAPAVTLYHWDLPQALEDDGGWPNRDTAFRFADYADVVFEALGDRVPMWITLNEPWCSAFLGYGTGVHAPGRSSDADCAAAGHTLLLAHGLAVQRFRARGLAGAIGITENVSSVTPATTSDADRAAASRYDAFMNRWFLDPIFRGAYPEELAQAWGALLPSFSADEMAAVTSPIDFLGLNYYTRAVVRDDPGAGPLRVGHVRMQGAPHTAMDWEIYPDGLREILTTIDARYDHPTLYVTENGAAFDEAPGPDGIVHDAPRREYLRDHFAAAHMAMGQGVRLRGYYVWSLLDNFEWAYGYSRTFGIVHTDYATQVRTPKESARWYAEVIRTNAVDAER